ncbi:MAG: hypothetical protein LBI72_00515 [Flavobacteriaceae bacterium]|jgi:hypothetical protein|nr:hypothetical protein [Flavobacteriaceae bacterium]
MKKIVIFSFLFIVLVACLLVGYKIWQRSIMDLSPAQIESIESIKTFSKSNVKGDVVLVAKDSMIFKEINNFFGIGSIWVFDKKGKTIESNIEQFGGICFSDIKKEIIEEDLKFSNLSLNQKFFNQENDFYKKLINSTIVIDDKEIDINKYDYVITYGWAKYYGMSYKNDQIIDIYDYIKKNNKKVLLIAVNTDLMDFWDTKNSISK